MKIDLYRADFICKHCWNESDRHDLVFIENKADLKALFYALEKVEENIKFWDCPHCEEENDDVYFVKMRTYSEGVLNVIFLSIKEEPVTPFDEVLPAKEFDSLLVKDGIVKEVTFKSFVDLEPFANK